MLPIKICNASGKLERLERIQYHPLCNDKVKELLDNLDGFGVENIIKHQQRVTKLVI